MTTKMRTAPHIRFSPQETKLPDHVIKTCSERGTKEERTRFLSESTTEVTESTTVSVTPQNGHCHHLSVTEPQCDTSSENKSISPSRSVRSMDEVNGRKSSQRASTDGRNSSIRLKAKFQKQRHSCIKTKYELREQRATKRMAIVMACFLVCWIPFLFMYTIRSFCASCDLNVHIQASIIWLGYANSGINPILYTLFNDDFRKAFKLILGFKTHKKPVLP